MYNMRAGTYVRRKLNISEARSRLPELARYLSQHPDAVVLVEHRDLPGPLALTTEEHVRYLENLVEELRRQVGQPFVLAGSMSTHLSDTDLEVALREMRDEQAEGVERRLRELTS